MRFVDEYRDPDLAHALAARIATQAEPGRHYKIMEVCGGRATASACTTSCPRPSSWPTVPAARCVVPMGRVDDAIAIAERPDDVILTCFGDMMRVPGSNGSFLDTNARGADIRMVYSPLDALRIARQNADRQVIFYAIGLETTAPSTALTLVRAKREGIENSSSSATT